MFSFELRKSTNFVLFSVLFENIPAECPLVLAVAEFPVIQRQVVPLVGGAFPGFLVGLGNVRPDLIRRLVLGEIHGMGHFPSVSNSAFL